MSGADPGEARKAALAAAFEAAGITVMELVELQYLDRYTLAVELDQVTTDVIYDGRDQITNVQVRGLSASATDRVNGEIAGLPPEVLSAKFKRSAGLGRLLEARHRMAFEAAGLSVLHAQHTSYLISYTIDDDGLAVTLRLSYNAEGKVTPQRRAHADDRGVWQAAVGALGLKDAPDGEKPPSGEAAPPDDDYYF